ncbi:xylosidase/arabinosidase [Xylaria digitata]|nr:xylosidase/arabinosidase [Xylaria digitata]
MTPPLITHLYTADPSAHVFEGKVYIYPSHDRETDIKFNDNGDQYDMTDYHVFSTSTLDPPYAADAVTDHGVVLRAEDVPWVSKQLWAPDAATKNGKYYLYFPARDKEGIFRIGVAEGDSPAGPFRPDPEPIAGSFSIDPASFVDPDTGSAYLYFGGLWGGQLQCYQGTVANATADAHGVPPFDKAWEGPKEPSGSGKRALHPKVAPLTEDMHGFASAARDLVILAPETGEPLAADDHDRRFFEAAWMHKRGGTYYFSYSTGDSHYLVYATGDSPLGPFTYAGRILEPVLGWTTHHSIVEFRGRWWLFHHDCEISKGVSHLRNVKVTEIFYGDEGRILPVKSE